MSAIDPLQDARVPGEIVVAGVRVHPMTLDELVDRIAAAVDEDERAVFGHHNLHSVYLVHHDTSMAEFNARASVNFIDGMGVVALGRLLAAQLKRRHRVTYVDLIDPLCSAAARHGWRLVHVGGRPGVGEAAALRLVERHRGLKTVSIPGEFDANKGSAENRAVIARVRDARPDVLLVGMGMPRQERWVLDNIADLDVGAVLTCGACMDYVAGVVATPPRWAGRWGLEWCFRLAREPRRLARRYLFEPWFVARLVARELLTRRMQR